MSMALTILCFVIIALAIGFMTGKPISGWVLIAIIGLVIYVVIRAIVRSAAAPAHPTLPTRTWTGSPPKPLQDHYLLKYPHNPEGVLESHLARLIKEGKTREEAERELMKELGIA